jgi:hypothetical protein
MKNSRKLDRACSFVFCIHFKVLRGYLLKKTSNNRIVSFSGILTRHLTNRIEHAIDGWRDKDRTEDEIRDNVVDNRNVISCGTNFAAVRCH